jgi:SAM-dependent methyltransferase
MLFKFRRMRAMDPLQVAMTGVRMGERYLQIFCSDAALTRGLATKTGLSGVAALAAADDAQGRRAQAAAEKAGVLIDIKVTAISSLPWADGSFDMVVIDNTGASFDALDAETQRGALQSVRTVLRNGGRAEFIERTGGGLFAGARDTAETSGAVESALTQAGFKPVRTLAEKDGFRFVEGLKG